MTSLVPCSSCNRHVDTKATACPFCGIALPPRHDSLVCQGPCAGHAFPRLGRAALAAAGATLLCASCVSNVYPAYGIAINPDAGGQNADAAPTGDAATSSADAGADGTKKSDR